jgi:hypothetical protein
MNKTTIKELQKVKLNVKNIHSVLINANKKQEKLSSSITDLEKREEQKKKFEVKERRLESPFSSSLDNIKKSVKPSGDEGGGNIFDKLFEFIGLLLAGILVNALPRIIEKGKEIIDGITSFFAPIQSTFSLIIGFLTGELDKSDYDADKKRVNDGFNKLNRKGGLVDKMLDKTGPLKPLIQRLLNAFNSGAKGGRKIVLAKQGGKEGFYNQETKKFTERQWTSEERRSYEGDDEDDGDVPAGNISTLVPEGGLKGLTDDDWKELAYIVSGEAQRGTDDEYGVAANVLTRVAHPGWPNNIRDVGRQRNQYEAVYTGKARYEPALAQSLKENQGKIADALKKLNGRDSFKGTSQYKNMGSGDVKFSPRGNFYHYGNQRKKSDPPPPNPDQNWKKWLEDAEAPMGEGGSLSMFSPLIDKNKLDTINQPMYEDMDDEEEMVNISIQPVNTIRTSYIYSPIPRRVRQASISPSSKLPPIWSM